MSVSRANGCDPCVHVYCIVYATCRISVCVCVCVCLPKLPNGRESNQMLIGGALPLAVCGESVVCL